MSVAPIISTLKTKQNKNTLKSPLCRSLRLVSRGARLIDHASSVGFLKQYRHVLLHAGQDYNTPRRFLSKTKLACRQDFTRRKFLSETKPLAPVLATTTHQSSVWLQRMSCASMSAMKAQDKLPAALEHDFPSCLCPLHTCF